MRATEVATLPLSYNYFPRGMWARVEAEVGGQEVVLFLSRNAVGLSLCCPQWPAPAGKPFYTVVPHGGDSVVVGVGGEVTFVVIDGFPEPHWFRAVVKRVHVAPGHAEGVIPAELLAFDPDARPVPAVPRSRGVGGQLVRHAASVLSHAASYPVGRVRAW
jgi:hypothetical protein